MSILRVYDDAFEIQLDEQHTNTSLTALSTFLWTYVILSHLR
jgi:hypothetical protein